MDDLFLTEDQHAIRDMVRDFVNNEIRPTATESERLESFSPPLMLDLIEKASELGLRTLGLPESSGGAGANAVTCCIVAEEMAAGDIDVATVLATTSALGSILFSDLMTPEQSQRFLPAFIDDHRYHLALADNENEPQAENALGINYYRPNLPSTKVMTTATKDAGEWAINGTKVRVSNAPIAKLFLVEAAVGDAETDVRTFLVPHDTPGLRVSEIARDGGWYHGACADVTFEDCRVPFENLLDEAAGMTAWKALPVMPSVNLGVGRAAFEAALDYAKLREQGGRPIIEHQAIGLKLADIAIDLEVARSAIWQAAWWCDTGTSSANNFGELPRGEVAKILTSQVVYRATKEAAECFGAMGVMRDMPQCKFMQDARIILHSGSGITDAKLRVAEAIAGYWRH